MTEEEAKTKWCPFARVSTLKGGVAGNMGCNPEAEKYIPLGRCIGSACMAWRSLPATEIPVMGKHLKKVSREGEIPVRHTAYDKQIGKTVIPNGFCGLAGKP